MADALVLVGALTDELSASRAFAIELCRTTQFDPMDATPIFDLLMRHGLRWQLPRWVRLAPGIQVSSGVRWDRTRPGRSASIEQRW